MDDHLLGIFAAEAESLLERMAREALALEEGAAAPGPHVDQLFRDAHTIKGSAALVGLEQPGALAHVMEDVLGDLRAGRRDVTPAVVDLVLRAIDDLREVVAGALGGQDAAPLVDAAVARLRGAEAGGGGPAEAPPPGEGLPGASDAGDAGPADGDAPGAMPAAPSAPGDGLTAQPGGGEELVRVSRARLDRLVRLAGEAVADGLRLRHRVAHHLALDPDANADAVRLERTLRLLQRQTLAARMTTLTAIAEPLRRAVRDVARSEGRLVRFVLDAEAAELDRAVLDGLRDPLLHLVRNAVGHGLEPPDDRRDAGKDETGTLTVRAHRAGAEVVVEVADDGRGMDLAGLRERAAEPDADDEAAARLAFRPGLSTAQQVTGLAGRGVGLDAVAEAMRELRGRVDVRTTPGEGTTFSLRVPVSLAVLPCLLVACAGERYALPAFSAARVLEAADDARVALEGRSALWSGGELVPVSRLAAVLGHADGAAEHDGPAVVLTGAEGRRHAFRVDELLGQRSVTVTELGGVLPPVPVVAGASIEPDGSVVLVLDPLAVVTRATGTRRAADGDGGTASEPPRAVRVLVVDDALTVRELQRSILERAGYDVAVAADGEEALEEVDAERPDIVVTDLEMPRLDGLGLVRGLRSRPGLQGLPVLVVSSRADEEDRRRALQAGADGYIVKRDFDEDALLSAIRDLLGDTST